MKHLTITELPLNGLKRVERQHRRDARGFFSRLFCKEELLAAGWHQAIAQINHTQTSHAGTVRGLHFQHPPHTEMKLVSCIRGHVWDVAVDLRVGSETFLQWHAEYLSADNGHALLIPEGFAHGFQALTNDVEMLYLHSIAYNASSEGGLHPQDPMLAISWPKQITELSLRDAQHPFLNKKFIGVAL